MSKPILCLDFDGVIHSYSSGWKGAGVIPDPPVPGAIPWLLAMLDAGFDVAIFSSRSRNLFGRRAMKRWLAREIAEHWQRGSASPSFVECECWGDAAGIHRRFSWPWLKPPALMTIDDRALTFNGDWSDPAYTPEAIRAFKPWNKTPQKIEPHKAFDFGALQELRHASS
jgi:hypothetical protein